ncbi:DUF885 family protein, partial [Porticoccaceae bacterium]|nr:DUF885 family protein [Porticoccaceae bacterium]
MAQSLKTIILAVTAAFLLSGCNAKPADSALTSEQAISLLDQLFMEELNQSPEYLTYLGMRERYDEWNDISDAASERGLVMTQRHLAQVKAIDTSALNASAKLSVRMFIEQSEQSIAGHQWRHHNYPVNQMRGVHSMVPSFLINQHLIANYQEAEAYIGRIKNSALLMEQLLDQLKTREEKGIIPPQFVFPRVLKSIDNILSGAPFDTADEQSNESIKDSTILADFRAKIAAAELSKPEQEQLLAEANNALRDYLAPGYQRIHNYMSALHANA